MKKSEYYLVTRKLVEEAESNTGQKIPYNETDFTYIFSKPFWGGFKESSKKSIPKHYLTPKEWLNYLNHWKSHPRNYTLFKLFLSGCRLEGAIGLLIENIHFDYCYFGNARERHQSFVRMESLFFSERVRS